MRTAATFVVALLLLLLQAVAIKQGPGPLPVPAFGVLGVLHVGLSTRWTLSSACLIGFTIGYVFDLVSGAPTGTHALVYVVIALGVRLVSGQVSVQGVVARAGAAFVASGAAALLIIGVRSGIGAGSVTGGFRVAVLEALSTGLAGPLVLWIFERVNGRIDPERARVGLSRASEPPGSRLRLP